MGTEVGSQVTRGAEESFGEPACELSDLQRKWLESISEDDKDSKLASLRDIAS